VRTRTDRSSDSYGRLVLDRIYELRKMSSESIEPKVSPSVLVWARTSSGLTIPDVLRRLGVAAERLNEWETGREVPSISKLESLAETYHRPLATFLLDEPPKETPSPPDLRVVAERAGKSAFSEKTLLAIRRARRVQQVAYQLLPERPPNALARLQRLTANLSPDDAALKVAAEIGVPPQEPPRFVSPYQAMSYWRALVERLGILVLQFPMPIDDARGFTLSEGHLPLLVVNQSDFPKARNFTLFHELAHLLQRTVGVCDLGGELSDRRAPPVEVWCNAFAGSFLVPQAHLMAQLRPWPRGEDPPADEIRRLSNRYQVSETAVLRRLLSAGVISQTQYRTQTDLRRGGRQAGPRAESTGVKRNIPVERVAEYGAPFVSMVLRGAYDGRLALSDVADILDVRLKHIPTISDRAAAILARA
jgi:Zn-dependent peptidase ImmA (M78 family)/transcriptional regulator with XRE-family HTH domain